MQRVFITGGAGFIGRWVARQALQDGLDVAVYDNLSAGSRDHVAEFADRITLLQDDIMHADALQGALDTFRPDTVIHLAALHFIPYCNAHPTETLRVNTEGTYAVLTAAAKAGVKRAVVASSGIVYPSVDDLLEEDGPLAPPDIYGLSKRMAEEVTEYVARTTGMHAVVARLFNTYGPFETNPHLIPHILERLHRGRVVDLGNIYTKRDYVYVEDVARLLVAAARAAEAGCEVINVGTGAEASAEEIIGEISSLMGEPIEIQVDPDRVRKVDKMHQRASTRRLEAFTGQRATHDLQDGLRKLLQHEGLLTPAPQPVG